MRPRFYFVAVLLVAASPAVAGEPVSASVDPSAISAVATATPHASDSDRAAYMAALIKKATDRRLYLDRHWLMLLHDRPDGRGGFKSEADGPTFFLAPNGKTDTNNNGPFSTDHIGKNYAWPDGDYATREKVFQEIRRPVFSLLEKGPLADSCTYLSYDSLHELASQKHLAHLSDTVLDEYAEEAE